MKELELRNLESRMRFPQSQMGWRRYLTAVVLLGIATSVVAKDQKRPITVVAEPTANTLDAGADPTVKLTIMNNSVKVMSFSTCPGPLYKIEINDSRGSPVPQRVLEPAVENNGELPFPSLIENLVDCVSSILVTLEPGKSWSTTVLLSHQYFDLRSPGSYTGRIIWLTVGEVPSNLFHFTIRARDKG